MNFIQQSPGTFLVRNSMREKKNILGVLNEENQFKNYVIEESVSVFGAFNILY